MTIKDLLNEGIKILKSCENEAPVFEAGVILCFVINCDRAFLYSHGERELNADEKLAFFELIKKRVNGEPLQYIIGHQEFMGIDFIVNRNVLIPRSDTEVLVEAVIEHVSKLKEKEVSILEIGTGSGCIAISLAYYLKCTNITSVDISKGALEVAGMNAVKAGVKQRVTFLESDIFNAIDCSVNNKDKFDIIVSNPPYIPEWEIETLKAEVKGFEPLSALNGGNDGLFFYREIINNSQKYLKPNGLLALEVGYNQALEVCELMEKTFGNISTVKDLSNIDRVVIGNLCL